MRFVRQKFVVVTVDLNRGLNCKFIFVCCLSYSARRNKWHCLSLAYSVGFSPHRFVLFSECDDVTAAS
jgi:hypothetical protein